MTAVLICWADERKVVLSGEGDRSDGRDEVVLLRAGAWVGDKGENLVTGKPPSEI